MSRLPGRLADNKDIFMEIDETSKPDAGVNLVHLTYYRDFGDIFAQQYKPLARPSKEHSGESNKEQQSSKSKNKHSVVLDAGSEDPVELTTGHIARFAAGSVVASQGDNAVLATCVYKPSSSNAGFLPLTVDYRQSAAAVGKIPTNYLRRELSQTDADVIASRIIDRTIRPIFPKAWMNETQVICKPLSLDDQSDGIILAVNAAGAALHLSPIPFLGPVAAVRLALADGKVIVNPCRETRADSSLNMILSGCGDNKTVMIEMDGDQIPLSLMEEIFDVGFKSINEMLRSLDQLRKDAGKDKLNAEESGLIDNEKIQEIQNLAEHTLEYILTDSSLDKIARDNSIKELGQTICDTLSTTNYTEFWSLYYVVVKSMIRKLILETERRCDGRGLADFRPITINVDVYKKLHGSALFQRGQTQVFSTVTFDSPAAAFQPDIISLMMGTQQKKMFMHHYEFPSFATNDIATSRQSSNRREIGHGALAEKALKHVVPKEFPYTIRLASQVLESNGSSSMASVCSGTLALLDAGVPLKASAAGVAMGIITGTNPDEEYKILTDLLGIEDYNGDMDFKIAGTRSGLTAMQLDVKIGGLTRKQLSESLSKAQIGLDFVLDKMAVMRDRPRDNFKSSVPIIDVIALEPFKRSMLFRKGGLNAKQIEADTGVKIFVDDDTHISLFAPDKFRLVQAKEMMDKMFTSIDDFDFSFGQIITVEVIELLDKGIKVTIPGSVQPVFVPNKGISHHPIQHSSASGVKVGEKFKIQWLGRDPQTGVIRLSRRTLSPGESQRAQIGRK